MAIKVEKGKGLKREASDCRLALVAVIEKLPLKKFQGKVAGELFEVFNAVDQCLIRVQQEL
jgi:hypothetical protein